MNYLLRNIINMTSQIKYKLKFYSADTLYKINTSLINADRDFYQAQLAAVEYYEKYSGEDEVFLQSKIESFDENKQQTFDNSMAACEIARENPKLFKELKNEDGKSYEELYNEFVGCKYKIILDILDFICYHISP